MACVMCLSEMCLLFRRTHQGQMTCRTADHMARLTAMLFLCPTLKGKKSVATHSMHPPYTDKDEAFASIQPDVLNLCSDKSCHPQMQLV